MAEGFKMLEKLGEGTFGVVYKARCKRTRRIVAIKDIKIFREKPGSHPDYMREMTILRNIPPHRNIVKLLGGTWSPNECLFCFEFMTTDLKRFISTYADGKLIEMDLIKSYTHQLLSGLSFCHQNRVIHRDIKPQNVLVRNNKTVKLADFGNSRFLDIREQPLDLSCGTLWFRPPEILLGADMYSLANDVWSLGCVMAEMVTKQPLFKGDCNIGQLFSIFRVMRTPTETIWPGVKKFPYFKTSFPQWENCVLLDQVSRLKDEPQAYNLLEKLLILSPLERITSKDAYEHPFFSGFDSTQPQPKRRTKKAIAKK